MHNFWHILAAIAGSIMVIAIVIFIAIVRKIEKPNGWNG